MAGLVSNAWLGLQPSALYEAVADHPLRLRIAELLLEMFLLKPRLSLVVILAPLGSRIEAVTLVEPALPTEKLFVVRPTTWFILSVPPFLVRKSETPILSIAALFKLKVPVPLPIWKPWLGLPQKSEPMRLAVKLLFGCATIYADQSYPS